MSKEKERMCIPVKKDDKLAYHIYLEESFEKLPEYLKELETATAGSVLSRIPWWTDITASRWKSFSRGFAVQ